jgi:hypothetical protein
MMKPRAQWIKTTSFLSWNTGEYEFWAVFAYGDRRYTIYLGKLS